MRTDIACWVLLVVGGFIGLSSIPEEGPGKTLAISIFTFLVVCSGTWLAIELKRGKP